MTNRDELSAAAKHKFIEAAARAKNPLDTLPYDSYKSSTGEQFKLYCRAKNDMDAKALKWTFKLAEQNVGPYYKQLKMGWKPKIKQAELNKNWARFLVAQNEKKETVAYTMFRFDMDDGDCVLYCYEIQISPEYQRKGLGKFMMQTLDACARHWQLEKIMLTVLNNNENSLTFFNALGYVKDETSPDILEEADYQILINQYQYEEDTITSTSSLGYQFNRKFIPIKMGGRETRDDYYKDRKRSKPTSKYTSSVVQQRDKEVETMCSTEERIRIMCDGKYKRQEGGLANREMKTTCDSDSNRNSNYSRGNGSQTRRKETSYEDDDRSRKSLDNNNSNINVTSDVLPLKSETQPDNQETKSIPNSTLARSRVVYETSKDADSWETTFETDSK